LTAVDEDRLSLQPLFYISSEVIMWRVMSRYWPEEAIPASAMKPAFPPDQN
jgi:hypothetical protein